MNMKRLISLVAIFATLQASAQQVNPVPDYVFANRMSAGRNTVTDTAAYLSIGPRYGATRGMMPPMVVDTASFSGNKRNGLLIFSVQKNKFLYWDSVGVKWAEMAGTGGSAITGSGVAGYMPEFTTTTNLDTTKLYHSAGRFAIGSTTVSNGVFNVYGGQSYFDTSLLIGNSVLFANEASGNVGIGSSSPSYKLVIKPESNYNIGIGMLGGYASINVLNDAASAYRELRIDGSNIYVNSYSAKELILNTSDDVGDYKLQVTGNIYNTASAMLSVTSGSVNIGTTTTVSSAKVNISSTTQGFLPPRMTTTERDAISSPANGLIIYNTTTSKLQVYATTWTDLH
jgi:hypothetical protein